MSGWVAHSGTDTQSVNKQRKMQNLRLYCFCVNKASSMYGKVYYIQSMCWSDAENPPTTWYYSNQHDDKLLDF